MPYALWEDAGISYDDRPASDPILVHLHEALDCAPITETADTADEHDTEHDTVPGSEPDTVPGSGSAFSPEQALADIRAAFGACFTPDFNGVDWHDDKAIQTLAASVYDILDRAAIAQETST